MRNVFAMHEEKALSDNPCFEGDCFITKRLDARQQSELEAVDEAFEKQITKLTYPTWFIVTKYVLFCIGMFLFLIIFRSRWSIIELGLAESFQKVPYLYIGMAICLICSGIMHLMGKSKEKKHSESDEFQDYLEESDATVSQIRQALGIPKDAVSIDVLAFFYIEKKGKTVSAANYDYEPLDLHFYADETNFYLADDTSVYTFCRNEIIKLEKISKKITISSWNKDDDFRSTKYKPFKIVETQDCNYRFKDYYSLQMNSRYGLYEILIPSYDMEAVAKLLGLQIPEA